MYLIWINELLRKLLCDCCLSGIAFGCVETKFCLLFVTFNKMKKYTLINYALLSCNSIVLEGASHWQFVTAASWLTLMYTYFISVYPSQDHITTFRMSYKEFKLDASSQGYEQNIVACFFFGKWTQTFTRKCNT